MNFDDYKNTLETLKQEQAVLQHQIIDINQTFKDQYGVMGIEEAKSKLAEMEKKYKEVKEKLDTLIANFKEEFPEVFDDWTCRRMV